MLSRWFSIHLSNVPHNGTFSSTQSYPVCLFGISRPHVELVNILLGCGERVRVAITRRIHAQCEQNWGALCASLSLCLPGHTRIQTAPTLTPVPAISNANFLPSADPPLLQPDRQQA